MFSGRKLSNLKGRVLDFIRKVKAMDLNGTEDGRSKLGSLNYKIKRENTVCEMYSQYYALCVLECSVCCMTEIKHIWLFKNSCYMT